MIDKYHICSYRDYLEKYLKKKFPNSKNQDVEDAVQDAIVKAMKHQDNWQKNCSLKTWLTKITVNMYFNIFRKTYQKYEDTVSSKEMFFIFDGTINDFSDEICSNKIYYDLHNYLFSSTENDITMKTFKLFAFDNLNYDEIAEKENIPIGTVKSRIFKARQKLRIRYEKFFEQQS